MYCKYCGRQIADDSKFCEFCGNMIQKSQTEQPLPDIVGLGDPIVKQTDVEESVRDEAFVEMIPQTESEQPTINDQTMSEDIPEPTPKMRTWLWWLIGGGAALIVAIVVTLILVLGGDKPVKLDVTEYIDFTVGGYDGYGKATCELDWDSLEIAAFGEYPSGSDSSSRKKQIEYKEKAATLKSAITLDFEERNNVSVGDVLICEVSINTNSLQALKIEFSSLRRVEYTVTEQDLDGSQKIDLLGEFTTLEVTGLDGSAVAKLSAAERENEYRITLSDGSEQSIYIELTDTLLSVKILSPADKSTQTVDIAYQLSKKDKIATGDNIVVTLSDDAKDALKDYGLVVEPLSTTHTVKGLESLVSEFAQLDKATLEGWKTMYVSTLENYVYENWDACLHGGNATATEFYLMENTTHVQSLLVTSETKQGKENALYLIYSADISDDAILTGNFGMPQTYYFAIRLRGLHLDDEGKLLGEKVLAPEQKQGDYIGGFTQMGQLLSKVVGTTDTVVSEYE